MLAFVKKKTLMLAYFDGFYSCMRVTSSTHGRDFLPVVWLPVIIFTRARG
jgi:hypothetical protein